MGRGASSCAAHRVDWPPPEGDLFKNSSDLKLTHAAVDACCMTDAIYISMSGAAARLQELDTIADNLANAETPGFRAGLPRFEAYLADGAAGNSPAHVGLTGTSADPRPGDPRVTGRPLDVRMGPDAWLTVLQPDESLAYTRDGRVEKSADGTLTIGGRPVLGSTGGAIIVPVGGEVRIDAKGVIFSNEKPIDALALVALHGPLQRIGPALVSAESTSRVASKVHVGEIEGSNARALDCTVQLIAAQRAYDYAMQAIQASRRLDERAAELSRKS
jgi:flagellar basal-body rod protein FlgF